MDLSYRLQQIANKVKTNSSLADIGTDHAYIPIYLSQRNILKKAIACDISKGSLQKAIDNIKKYNLSDKIETRLSNGLDKISIEDKIDTIIIAGMGGMLMIDIVSNKIDICKNSTLILQPQKDIDKVRKYLHKEGFKIIKDEILKDEGKYYNIIVSELGKEENNYTELDYTFGKFEINEKSPILKEYLEENLYKMENVLKNIDDKKGDKTNLKLYKDIELFKEVLKCL